VSLDDKCVDDGLLGFIREHPLLSLAAAIAIWKVLEKKEEPRYEEPPLDLDWTDEMEVWKWLRRRD
jgi:hypothetical protein